MSKRNNLKGDIEMERTRITEENYKSNLEHTQSKLGIFIEQALPDYLALEWKHATGKMEAAKKKYLQLYNDIYRPIYREDKRNLAERIMQTVDDCGAMPDEVRKLDTRVWEHLTIYIPTKEILKSLFRKLFRLSI